MYLLIPLLPLSRNEAARNSQPSLSDCRRLHREVWGPSVMNASGPEAVAAKKSRERNVPPLADRTRPGFALPSPCSLL